MEELIRRNFIRVVIAIIGIYLLLVTSLLCKDTTIIKDDIIGREYENKKLTNQIKVLNKVEDSLNNIINNQNSILSDFYQQEEVYNNEIKRLRKITLKKEYEKAAVFTRNFTSDSIVRYFSNL
jgi:hypothetical protein